MSQESSLHDLLVAVSKYPPSEKSPRENFFTECVRYVLSNDPALLTAFLELVTEGRVLLRGPLRVTSQVRIKDAIIDLVISDKTRRILVEVKVGARENTYRDDLDASTRGQVQKYLDISEPTDRVCLISARDETPEIKRHAARTLRPRNWKEVYALIEKHYRGKGHGTVPTFVARNLLSLMEHWDMKPFSGFTAADIKASGTSFLDLFERVMGFLEYVKASTDVRGYLEQKGFEVIEKHPRYDKHLESFVLEFKKRVRQGKKRHEYWFCMGFDYFSNTKNMDEYFVCEQPRVGLMFYCGLWVPKETFEDMKKRHVKLPVSTKRFCAQYCLGGFLVFDQMPFQKFVGKGTDAAIGRILESLKELDRKGVFRLVEKNLMK